MTTRDWLALLVVCGGVPVILWIHAEWLRWRDRQRFDRASRALGWTPPPPPRPVYDRERDQVDDDEPAEWLLDDLRDRTIIGRGRRI